MDLIIPNGFQSMGVQPGRAPIFHAATGGSGVIDTQQPDPVLTPVSLGVAVPELVKDKVFPRVGVDRSKFRVFDFGMSKAKVADTRRAVNSPPNQVKVNVSSDEYGIGDQALAMVRDVKELREGADGLNLDIRNMETLTRIFYLSLEAQVAALAYSAANYPTGWKATLTGNDKWDAAHADSDPRPDFLAARNKVRSACGINPNTLLISAWALSKLKRNYVLVSANQYISGDHLTDAQLLESLDLPDTQIVVTTSMYYLGGVLVDLWSQTQALLCYVPRSPMEETPALGYQFVRNGSRDARSYEDLSGKQRWYQISEEAELRMIYAKAGYLWTDCVSAPS